MLGVPFGFVFQGCGIWFWFLRGERVWVFVWFLILFFSGFFFFFVFCLDEKIVGFDKFEEKGCHS